MDGSRGRVIGRFSTRCAIAANAPYFASDAPVETLVEFKATLLARFNETFRIVKATHTGTTKIKTLRVRTLDASSRRNTPTHTHA